MLSSLAQPFPTTIVQNLTMLTRYYPIGTLFSVQLGVYSTKNLSEKVTEEKEKAEKRAFSSKPSVFSVANIRTGTTSVSLQPQDDQSL